MKRPCRSCTDLAAVTGPDVPETYTVKPGDSLTAIAFRFKLCTQDPTTQEGSLECLAVARAIQQLNPAIIDINKISVGQVLRLRAPPPESHVLRNVLLAGAIGLGGIFLFGGDSDEKRTPPSRRPAAKGRGRAGKSRSLGELGETMYSELREAEKQISAGDCEGGFSALLSATGMLGAELEKRGRGDEGGEAARVAQKFADACLVKRKKGWF